MIRLKETFVSLLKNYSVGDQLIEELWLEVARSYSGKQRHYHTLTHLEQLLSQLTEVKNELKHWDTVLFSLYYHDIVYRVLRSDNEEKSAEWAKKSMQRARMPKETVVRCQAQILATKTHQHSADHDTNYFTDADLSVLGRPWEEYTHYYQRVRKEYAVYPDAIYRPGRKKVLQHFLAMNKIYKTDFFYDRYEKQAKLNLRTELELL